MNIITFIKRHYLGLLILVITCTLFFIPFFWLKPGFVDLGGDGGRLYFIDPLSVLQRIMGETSEAGAVSLAEIPAIFFIYVAKLVIHSPSILIGFEHGSQLALAFYFTYLVIQKILRVTEDNKEKTLISGASLIGGLVYVGFITVFGWPNSLLSHNQVFLNPLFFYLLLRLCLENNFLYIIIMLVLSFIYSANFGFESTPQLSSFFPLSILFILIYTRWIAHTSIPWKKLLEGAVLFLGLQAFQIIPLLVSLISSTSSMHTIVLGASNIQKSGVFYFEFNHLALGKLSQVLFEPYLWHAQNLLVVIIPAIALLGFLSKPSRLMGVLGVFFAITFFLVSANITQIGIGFYKLLFYIPGFMMFRSFNEKWYFVFSFYYVLLFSVSFYLLCRKKHFFIPFVLGVLVFTGIIWRTYPFFLGKTVIIAHFQSNNVPNTFTVDPDLTDAVSFVKKLPFDGNVLTLPLTFPYYQIAYGKQGGAYSGISLVSNLSGKKDYTGFWSFGNDGQVIFDALRTNDMNTLITMFQKYHIKYVFRNTDPRIMNNFPGYPYVYPGMIYSSKDQLPLIKDQAAYDALLTTLPIKKIYEKGFYSIYKFTDAKIYPPEKANPLFQKSIIAGRIVSLCIILLIIGISIRYVIRKKYEKG